MFENWYVTIFFPFSLYYDFLDQFHYFSGLRLGFKEGGGKGEGVREEGKEGRSRVSKIVGRG